MKSGFLKKKGINSNKNNTICSLQCRRFWWSIEWFAAILDSLQTGRIGARKTECRRGGGRGRENRSHSECETATSSGE